MSNAVFLRPDENGNWGKIGSDPAGSMSGLLTFQSGAVAIGNGTVQDVTGYDILTLNVTISATATVTYEGSIDGTNWITTPFYFMNGQANNSSASSVSGLRFSITGFKFFRARVSGWTSGTVDVSGYATIGNLTQITAAGQFGNVDNTSPTTNNLMGVGAFNLIFDGTNWLRQRSASALTADGSAGSSVPLSALMGFNGSTWDRVKTVNTGQLRATLYNSSGLELNANQSLDGAAGTAFLSSSLSLFNGSSWDRFRNNLSGTALSSAARTSNTLSSDITNFNHRGIVFFLNVTSASGTGGLQVGLQFKDVLSSTYRTVGGLPTAVIANGTTVIMYYPGVDAATTPSYYHQSILLPQVFRVSVTHGDASSYTYSVSYQMIL